MRLEFLLEEPSAEAFLHGMIDKLIPSDVERNFVVFQGKRDLLGKLPIRLNAYRKWLPEDWRIVVLVDEDRQDCAALKKQLDDAAKKAGFHTKSRPSAKNCFTVLNRIAVEELEAWYFGDVAALTKAYPGVSPSLASRAAYRSPDQITGGTWEALERVLQQAGHYRAGLAKIEAARTISAHMDPARNTSPSFRQFTAGLKALLTASQ